MTKDIMKQLSAKRKIPGSRRPLIFDRIKGSRDYRNSQVRAEDDKGVTTPWIREKIRQLSVYEHYIYNSVDNALKPVSDTIAVKCQELASLTVEPRVSTNNTESRERMTAYASAKAAANDRRRNEICLELAACLSELEVIDAALKHHLQRAENETQKHISAYWSGVLKAAGSEELPVEPNAEIPESPGKAVYLKHFARMMARISEALNGTITDDISINENDINGGTNYEAA